MGSEKKRIFIALLFSDEFKNQVAEAILPMQKQFSNFRWSSENKWHLTILPPHYWDEQEIKTVVDSLSQKLRFKKFRLESEKFVLGPLGRDKRMVWLRFENSGEFSDLKRQVSGIITGGGLAIDDFRQKELIHLTLARLKDVDHSGFREKSFNSSILCSSIEAWQVFLNPDGAVYQVVARFELE